MSARASINLSLQEDKEGSPRESLRGNQLNGLRNSAPFAVL